MDDKERVCRLIQRSREGNKKNKAKGITVRLFKEDKYMLSTRLNVCMRYDNPSFGHSLYYYGRAIYPTTNNKLECINKAGLLMLQKQRSASKKTNAANKKLFFYETLNSCPHVGLSEYIKYNVVTDNIGCYTTFDSKEKLIYVDIE